MILKFLRNGLGYIFAFVSYLTLPKSAQRATAEQENVAQDCQSLALYQFYGCPFCIKTRRAIHKLNLPIEYKDAQSGQDRLDLEQGGGQIKVPCLRIENNDNVTWMYESSHIIKYLQDRFS